ncbi:MAG: carboxypeptidase-like regulatory domain-containing protein, partial [Gammaproteobacteria bacterium]
VSIGFSVFFLLVWVIFFRLPLNYSALPIAGTVVDADSGEPLENAVVIAVWELERGFGLEGTIPSGYMNVTEVVTDRGGKYFIEGWGPSRRPGGAYLGHYAPRLIIFKDGYNYFARGNYYDSIFKDNRRNNEHRSSWDGETIKLKTFDGDTGKYLATLSSVSSHLHTVLNSNFGAGQCDWLNIPKIILAIEIGHQKVIETGILTSLIVPLNVLVKRKECNIYSREVFIMEHMI